MPTCPTGMRLLSDFATAPPSAYKLSRKRGFLDPPMLGNNARWQLFAAHRSTCHDCNESGSGFRPYDGSRPPAQVPPEPTYK